MIKDWKEAHSVILNELFEIWRLHKEHSPMYLFTLLNENESFKEKNEWWEYSINKNDASSVDPFQILMSLYSSSLSQVDMVARTKTLFNVFGIKKEFSNNYKIYFQEHFIPKSSQLMNTRSIDKQSEIWDFFSRVYTNKVDGLKKDDFKKRKNWFGVNIESFTIALYWIDFNSFLPLNTYSMSFLVGISAFNTKSENPKFMDFQYSDYFKICDKLQANKVTPYEFVQFSKKAINSNGRVFKYKKEINEFINSLKGDKPEKPIAEPFEFTPSDQLKDLQQDEEVFEDNKEFEIVGFILRGEKRSQLNNLNPNIPYCFSDKYKLEYDSEDNYSKIEIEPNLSNTYNIEGLQIMVNAIVGENGSGKSSITEVLFLIVNYLSFSYLNSNKVDFIQEEIKVDLFYKTNTLNRIKIDNGITIYKYNLDKDENNYKSPSSKDFLTKKEYKDTFNINHFCYMIGINYSLYGLNSRFVGEWIDPLFHKNDGYETPIVLNPKRDEGRIDVNIEETLAKNRLLSNIVAVDSAHLEKYFFNSLLGTKKPESIEISLDQKKLEKNRKNNVDLDQISDFSDAFIKTFKLSDWNSEMKYSDILFEYLFYKSIKICQIYLHYNKFLGFENEKYFIDDINGLVLAFKEDSSHITFKIRQIESFIRNKKLQELYEVKEGENSKLIKIRDLSDTIQIIQQKEIENYSGDSDNEVGSIRFLPPSIFDFNIKFSGGGMFESLSSGEKQKIYTINTMMYHVLNVNSVHYSSVPRTSYSNLLLVLDEIELYYHPEMQRKTLNDIITFLKEVKLDYIDSIQILFVTHSPFILSDIPSSNILRLEDGKPSTKDFGQTFGANIHDLLANDFFLENGFMGQFASEKINDTIKWLNNNERDLNLKENHREVINLIGEPILKRKLMEMFDDTCGENMEVSYLKRRLEELQNKNN